MNRNEDAVRRLGRGLTYVIGCVALMGLVTAAPTDEIQYDSEGNALVPYPCPPSAPGWDGFTYWSLNPRTFWIPRFNAPIGDEVPFTVTGLTRLGDGTPSSTWYRPSPTSTYFDGLEWSWQASSGTYSYGSVQCSCAAAFTLFGLGVYKAVFYTGAYQGYAIPVGEETSGFGTRGGGGGEATTVCLEYYEWWIDSLGMYHEEVLYTFCLDGWAQ